MIQNNQQTGVQEVQVHHGTENAPQGNGKILFITIIYKFSIMYVIDKYNYIFIYLQNVFCR